MDLSLILALFILSLLQASTRPQQQQQQQNVVEQVNNAPTATAASSPNPAQNQPLAELQNSLNKFLYQLQQTGEKVVAQPPPHPPLLFPAAMRHSGAAGGGGAGGDALGSASPAVRPLAPLGHPPLFPSSLLVPTPAHLPPTFRLPATVMEQHKAFPMDGSPTHPVVVFPVILEQSSKRHRIGIGTENNGTTETPTTQQNNNNNNNTLSSQDTKLFLALVERVLEQELARRLEHDSTHQQQQQQNNDANSNSTQHLPQLKRPNIAVRTDGHQIVLELPKNEADQDVQTVQHQGDNDELEQDLEERLLDSQKQLKTANTSGKMQISNDFSV
uniref:Mediator of RNA polymerase II transcription subunit 15 n=1 Tax=Globodera pallida TaxID=36090 RepID=A0A183C3N8_GLOPA